MMVLLFCEIMVPVSCESLNAALSQGRRMKGRSEYGGAVY